MANNVMKQSICTTKATATRRIKVTTGKVCGSRLRFDECTDMVSRRHPDESIRDMCMAEGSMSMSTDHFCQNHNSEQGLHRHSSVRSSHGLERHHSGRSSHGLERHLSTRSSGHSRDVPEIHHPNQRCDQPSSMSAAAKSMMPDSFLSAEAVSSNGHLGYHSRTASLNKGQNLSVKPHVKRPSDVKTSPTNIFQGLFWSNKSGKPPTAPSSPKDDQRSRDHGRAPRSPRSERSFRGSGGASSGGNSPLISNGMANFGFLAPSTPPHS
jgi:hypothetical protein